MSQLRNEHTQKNNLITGSKPSDMKPNLAEQTCKKYFILHKNTTYMWLIQSMITSCDRLPEKPKPSMQTTHYNYKCFAENEAKEMHEN